MAVVLRHSPRTREQELELLKEVLSAACKGHCAWPPDPDGLARRIAEAIVKERPDLLVLVLPGSLKNDSQDMYGEGFDIFAELQVQPELVASVLARSPGGGPAGVPALPAPASEGSESEALEAIEALLVASPPTGSQSWARRGVAAALEAEQGKGSPASACYFSIARELHFKVPLFVLWRNASSMASAAGAAGARLAFRAGRSVVDIFLFADHLGPSSAAEQRLVLAPTGAGKSTWRMQAPVFCPEGEVMDEVTFHPGYHRPLRLKPGGWLSSEEPAPSIFLRDLALLMRWLRRDRRRRVTFNCSGEVLEKAVASELLQPSEVCVVLPPEALHRRFLRKRRAALDGEIRESKQFKADPSLSQWDAGPLLNRETLLSAAKKSGVRVFSSFSSAAAASIHIFCTLRRKAEGSSEGPVLCEPAAEQLEAKLDLTMACGRRISEWISKGGRVAEEGEPAPAGERAVWQVSAACDDDDAYIVKSPSGFLLLTDGSTLISSEDPYRDPAEVFWTRAANEAAPTSDSSFWLCGRDATLRLHAERCNGCSTFDPPGPWRHVLPVHCLSDEDGGAGAVLWYPGSFAPFHQGHLDCLRAARQELQKQGVTVAGAYVKPQLQKSLSYKKLDEQASVLSCGAVRLRILELILAEEDWVMADPYAILRSSGNNFVDLRSFRANLVASLRRWEGAGRAAWASSVEIIWVIGDDAFPHLRDKLLSREDIPKDDALKQVGPFRMCVVHNRPSQWTALGPTAHDLPFPVLEVTAPPEFSADLSATAVREQWQRGAPVEELAQLLGSLQAARYMASLRPPASVS